jgi:uncharacterized membrane protein
MSVLNRLLDPSSDPSASAPDRYGVLSRLGFAGMLLTPILIVTALAVLLPPDGKERGDWMQFIGRFHPLLVHFPIALFLLVPILEVVGRYARFGHLHLSVNFVLLLATLSAIIAVVFGWCLGRSGGYSGTLITQHMWGGILLAIVCWLCWLLSSVPLKSSVVYPIALVVGAGLVAWTGYRGGQLSLGPNHLTEHMPNGMRSLLDVDDSRGLPGPPADPNTFYGARVQPILSAQCVQCHGANKQKGHFRLDNYRALMRGGKDGPVIQTGNIQASELLRRITLPASNDDFMPKGKRPLTAEQVKTIELWIAAGASDSVAVDAVKGVPAGSAGPKEVEFEEIDPVAAAKARSTLAPAVEKLQRQYPNILNYDSRGSADLRLDASMLGSKFSDRDLEPFAPVAENIVFADLSRTAITDHAADAIAAMKRIRVLRLMGTQLTDATLLRLDTLNQLESLSVYGTRVTPAVLPTIAKLPKLAHFYAGQTSIPQGKPMPEGLVGKVVF